MINKKKQLVFYSEQTVFGGAENCLVTLINSLDRTIFDLHMIFCSEQSKNTFFNKYEFAIKTYKTISLNDKFKFSRFKLIRFLRSAISLYLALQNMKVDIIHINFGGYPAGISSCAAVIVSRLLKIPKVLITVHNLAVPLGKYSIFDKILDNFTIKYTSKIICVSEAVKRTLIEYRNFMGSHIQVVYNSVIDWPNTLNEEVLKRKYDLPVEKKIIGVVARFEENKGHKYLIEAAKIVTKKYKNIIFLLEGDFNIGNGPEMIALTERLGIKNYFHFHGYSQDVRTLMSVFDILVVPSISYESFCLVLVEAMTQKVAVIGTDVGGIPEVIQNHVNGLIVPPANSEKLSEAILFMLNNDSEIEKMGVHGRKIFENNFSVSRLAGEMKNIYLSNS